MDEVEFSCPKCASSQKASLSRVGKGDVCSVCQYDLKVPPYGVVVGQVIGDFTIKKRLGIGGMGEVWLAVQESIQRDVALKILSPDLVSDAEFLERFMQEAHIAGKLSHPNIITAYQAGVSGDIHYLAISYVEGEVLDGVLRRKGKLMDI
ncbi:MAG: protein kinase, partial [Lentisphaeria bacterium]|nr:protein kinase [Lentisphaeria bacterium]